MSKAKPVADQVNLDDMQMDEASMELELIKLHANYRHLSDYYDSYKEETARLIHKQNQTICELLDERQLLERIMGSYNNTDQVRRDQNRKELTTILTKIQQHREEMMIELEKLQKDNIQLDELEDKLLAKRSAMGGLYGPLEHRLALYRRRQKLENKQNKICVALNDTLAGNRKLREQINHIRNERSVFYKLYNKVSAELEECKKKKAAILMSTSQALEQRQEAVTKIQVHKERDEKEQVLFDQSMKVLERMMCHDDKVNEVLTIKCNDRQEFKQEEAVRHEKEVRETLESDVKTLNQYKESYDCIREVAELDNTDAIVGKFLSQEAENFALFNYVTELNGQNESLAEEVHKIEEEIERMREQQAVANGQHQEELNKLQVEHDRLVNELTRSQSQLTQVDAVLDELKTLIMQTIERIGCSKTALEAALGLNTEISFSNMKAYLGQIEYRANELLNIFHYVNLKKSQETGLLPARIDVNQFVPKSLPTFTVLLPTMQDGDDEHFDGSQRGEDVHPMSRDEFKERALEGIIRRHRELTERLARESSGLPLKNPIK